jgi:hypothetical protein
MDGGNASNDHLTRSKDRLWMDSFFIFGGTFRKNAIEEFFGTRLWM